MSWNSKEYTVCKFGIYIRPQRVLQHFQSLETFWH